MTSVVAASASSTPDRLRPARGARKEDHAVSVARNVLKHPRHPCLTSAVVVGERNSGPQSGIELPAKFIDQALLVVHELDIALRDQHLTMTRLHPQKAHRSIMSKRARAPTRPRRQSGGNDPSPTSAPREPEHVNRAGPLPHLDEPVADGGRRDLLRDARRL